MFREQFLISLNVFKKHYDFTLLYLFFTNFYLCTKFSYFSWYLKFILYTRQDILIIVSYILVKRKWPLKDIFKK